MNYNLFEIFRTHFPTDTTTQFIETPDGKVYTYAHLERISAKFAGALVSAGAGSGDRVAVQVAKSPEAIFLYLACLRVGAIYLPLNDAYLASEIDYFLADAQPKVFVCRPNSEAIAKSLAKKNGVKTVLTLSQNATGSLLEVAADRPEVFNTEMRDADDPAAILYTSGTTGRPKGAVLSHNNLASNAQALHMTWEWQPTDVLLHALPIFHTHGLFVATNCVLMNGTNMIFLNEFTPSEIIRHLPRATILMGVPTHYVRLLRESHFGAEDCRNIRLFISGSAPLLPEIFNEFLDRTGHPILERYGMTEASVITAGTRTIGNVGPPLPKVEVRVTDTKGKEVAAGETGGLEVRGPNVFIGYWRNPEKTEQEFCDDGFFKTGDMARIDTKGCVSIVGREKDLIISGGLNVYPKEIEMIIDSLPEVSESAVIGLPHPDFGEAVTAVVVRQPGRSIIQEQKIIDTIRERIAPFKAPKHVFFVEDLPRNAMGKVQKNLLRARFRGYFDER